ncbi:VPA1267 family protein [Polaromonas sp. DSR2-3-2]|uniref:VPA1267 family protein n=1 Tax=unclassified Polaromonas TaxID=2638319 RepID=UPI003CE80FE8
MEKLSGRDMGVKNLVQFESWVAERDKAGDWPDYIRGDKLNRSEIAAECGFALSVVRQNPAVKEALAALEERLLALGLFGLSKIAQNPSAGHVAEASRLAVDGRILAAKGKTEQRVKVLEEQNATLRAEARDLREKLIRFNHLDAHLCATGRLLPP